MQKTRFENCQNERSVQESSHGVTNRGMTYTRFDPNARITEGIMRHPEKEPTSRRRRPCARVGPTWGYLIGQIIIGMIEVLIPLAFIVGVILLARTVVILGSAAFPPWRADLSLLRMTSRGSSRLNGLSPQMDSWRRVALLTICPSSPRSATPWSCRTYHKILWQGVSIAQICRFLFPGVQQPS